MAKQTLLPFTMNPTLRPAYLFSGGATTVEHLLNAWKTGKLPGVIPGCAIASSENAGGLRLFRGEYKAIPHAIIDPKKFASPNDFGRAILDFCGAHNVNFVGQYGWMPWTPDNVIARFKGQMSNQHPGPVRPGQRDFGGEKMHGIRVHAARLWFVQLTKREFWTEATSQLVDPQWDRGRVIIARRVEIDPVNDTPEILRDRVLPVEWQVQQETMGMFATGEMCYSNDRRPLVLDDEVAIWEECKKRAIQTYR
jgi:phosphoribosylglycinamide formyltransferase-1